MCSYFGKFSYRFLQSQYDYGNFPRQSSLEHVVNDVYKVAGLTLGLFLSPFQICVDFSLQSLTGELETVHLHREGKDRYNN